MAEETVRVYPHPKLAETNSYLPGIGEDGAEVEKETAQQMHDAGLVLFKKPKKVEPEPEPEPAPEPEPVVQEAEA